MEVQTIEYGQLEPHGAGFGPAGGMNVDNVRDAEFSLDAGDPPTDFTEDNSE